MGPWFVRAPLLLLSMLGLISGAWLRAPALWLALAVLVAVRVVVEWPLPDNHIYLLAYWCLGVAMALRFADPASQLARTSRLLLGLVFAFAVLWKAVLSPDYRDGRFFAVTLLTDDRFSEVVQLIGGLSDAQLRENREYLTPLPEGAELLRASRVARAPALPSARPRGNVGHPRDGGPGRRALAGAVDAPRLLVARHGVVLLFCLTTYAFAPVAGFGWLVIVLGLVTCLPDDRWLRALYIATYAMVLLYSEVPWASLALSGLG